MGFQSFLKGFLWLNNMILLMLGASVALYAAVLLAIFERERRKSGGDAAPAAPPPPPLAPGSDAPSYVHHVVADEPWCANPPRRSRKPPPRPAGSRENTSQMRTVASASHPGRKQLKPPSDPPAPRSPPPRSHRFLYALAGAGAYVATCAAVGACGADTAGGGRCGGCCLRVYAFAVSASLVAQTALAVAVFVNPGGYLVPPPDITGAEASAWRLIHANLSAVRWLAIALLVLQASSAAAATAIARNLAARRRRRRRGGGEYDSSDDDDGDWDDDDDEDDDEDGSYYGRRGSGGRRSARRPLLFPFLSDGADTDGTGVTTDDNESLLEEGAGVGAYGHVVSGSGGGGAGAYHDPFSPRRGDSAPESPSTPWSQRMREKYGLDTSRFTYDENAPRSGGGRSRLGWGRGDGGARGEGAGRCVVM